MNSQDNQHQNSPNEDMQDLFYHPSENKIPYQNQVNLYNVRNRKLRIKKSKRILNHELLNHSSFLDEPSFNLKQDNKKEIPTISFSDSLGQVIFNRNTDTKMNLLKKGNENNQYTYTKKKVDLPKRNCETQAYTERKKFIYYYRYNYPKKTLYEDENEDEIEDTVKNFIPKKIVLETNEPPKISEFSLNFNNISKISSINIASSSDMNKLNELFSSSSSGSQVSNRRKRIKIKRSEVSYESSPKEEDYQLLKSLQAQEEKSKNCKKKVVKRYKKK